MLFVHNNGYLALTGLLTARKKHRETFEIFQKKNVMTQNSKSDYDKSTSNVTDTPASVRFSLLIAQQVSQSVR